MKKTSSPILLIKKSINTFFQKKNFIYLMKVYSVSYVLAAMSFLAGFSSEKFVNSQNQYIDWFISADAYAPVLVFILIAAVFVLGLWAKVSEYEAVKRIVKGEKLEFKSTYSSSWPIVGEFFLTLLLIGLITLGGLILFIAPAIIFGIWYAFSIWGVVDKHFTPIQALKKSKALVKGRFWRIFGTIIVFILFAIFCQMLFSFIPQNLGGIAFTIFGGLFLLPYFLLYQELESGNKN